MIILQAPQSFKERDVEEFSLNPIFSMLFQAVLSEAKLW